MELSLDRYIQVNATGKYQGRTGPFLPPGEETEWGKNRPVIPGRPTDIGLQLGKPAVLAADKGRVGMFFIRSHEQKLRVLYCDHPLSVIILCTLSTISLLAL